MPLQWLPLQRRQPIGQPRTAVSQALTPEVRRTTTTGAMPTGVGFMERMKEEEALEAERKYQEKMMKMQHEQEMERMKFAAGLEEDAAKKITPMTAGQALGRAPTLVAPELTKENMPEAAMEVWKFISTLEPESQKFFIQQLKQKEQPTGYIEAAGKKVEVPGSVGMYGHLVDQGLIDPATDTVIEKKPAEMKGRFAVNTKTGEIYSTTTGEVMIKAGDIPKGVTAENIADALEWARKTSANYIDPTFLEGLDPERRTALLEMARKSISGFVADYLISVHKLSRKEAENIGNAIPPEEIVPEIGEEIITPPTATGRELPLNEAIAKDIAAHFKATPDADIEAYRDEYGDATVDRALELGEEPKPIVKPTVETPLPYVPSKSEKAPYEHRFRKR